MISALLTVGTSFLWIVVGTALVIYGLAGVVWLLDLLFTRGALGFPKKTALGLTVLVALGGVAGEASSWVEILTTGLYQVEMQSLAAAHTAAATGEMTAHEVKAAVAELNVDKWPTELSDIAVAAISLKAERYMDVLQSFYSGDVVRTAAVNVPAQAEATFAESDAKWTPLLIAAAAGDQVEFADGTLAGPAEAYLLAVANAWAKFEVLSALEAHHGINVHITTAERQIGPSLRWIGLLLQAADSAEMYEEIESVVAASEMVFDSASTPEMVSAAAESGAFEDPTGASYVAFTYENRKADLEASIALMGEALGIANGTDWAELNNRRRLLGRPTIDPVAEVQKMLVTERLPWQVDQEGLAVNRLYLAWLGHSLETLEQRWATISRLQ